MQHNNPDIYQELNRVGSVSNPHSSYVDNKQLYNISKVEAKQLFKNWLKGFGISLIPLCVLPLWRLRLNDDFLSILVDFVCNSEIIYISITLIITSMNDFIKINKKDAAPSGMWWLVICCFLYVITTLSQYHRLSDNTDPNIGISLLFGIGSIVITLLTAGYKYIKAIREGY